MALCLMLHTGSREVSLMLTISTTGVPLSSNAAVEFLLLDCWTKSAAVILLHANRVLQPHAKLQDVYYFADLLLYK